LTILTFDPSNKGSNITLASPPWETSPNLFAYTTSTSGWQVVVGTFSQSSGKFYWEWTKGPPGVSGANIMGGLCNSSVSLTTWLGNTANSIGLEDQGTAWNTGGTPGWTGAIGVGDVVGMACDISNKKFWVRVNGGSWLNGDPVAGTGGGTWSFSGAVFPAAALVGHSALTGAPFIDSIYLNGGHRALCASPPTGYSAWGSASSYASPTGAFDTLYTDSTTIFSNTNLTAKFNSGGGGAASGWRTAVGNNLITSGQVYLEATLTTTLSSGAMVGVITPMALFQDFIGDAALGIGWENQGSSWVLGTGTASALPTYTTGDVIGIAVDAGLKKLWMNKNGGSWQGGSSPNPATGSGGWDLSTLFTRENGVLPAVCGNGTNLPVWTMNFGGSAFAFTNPFAGGGGAGSTNFLFAA
jgi:hypothetical protein